MSSARFAAVGEDGAAPDADANAEARFQLLADNMDQLAWVCDSHGNVFWYNKRWLDYTGLSLEDMKGWKWSKVHHPDHVARVVETVKRSAETDEPWEDTFPLRGRDGTYRWFLSRAMPIRDESGKVIQWFGTNTDVNEQKLAEEQVVRQAEELRQLNGRLKELDRLKNDFFSNISHEFRTPLTLILGPIEDAIADAPGGPERDRLILVHRNTLRLQKLANTLLDFSRIEAGRVEATFRPVDLASVTRDLASGFRAAVERAGLRLIVECPPVSVPMYVDGDMYEKIVLNLLSNALKFTFIGKIEVRLVERPNVVEVSVRDTGAGIAPEHLAHVFERFRRIEGTRARTHEGTGIGLAVVKALVQLHGGTVAVDSAPGSGSTFSFVIPKGTAHLPADRVAISSELRPKPSDSDRFLDEALSWLPEATRSDLQSPADAHLRERCRAEQARERILLADDNADMRTYVSHMLSEAYDVEAVPDGEAALAAARRHLPDLVLTDVMMPGIDGFALVRELRRDPALGSVPVIMLSARAGEEATLDGLRSGVDDYLVKPFSARELLARVRTRLELARLRRDIRTQRERLYSVFMHAPAAICVLRGPDLVVEMANDRYAAIAGCGHGLDDVIREVMATGVAVSGREVVLGSDEAVQRAFLVNCAPLADGNEDDARAVLFFDDVTELVSSRTRLERAVKLDDLFVGILGHDLRNPLGSIIACADFLSLSASSSLIAEAAERITKSSRRMLRLVEQMLDFTRIRLGRGLSLQPAPTDVAYIARLCADELAVAWGREIKIETSGDCQGTWDPDRLAQLLSNLVGNACEHGHPDAHVAVSVDGSHDAVVKLDVHNRGAIPSELLPGLFEPVGQKRGRDELDASGLGLGLFIARHVAVAHGGTIRVESVADATSVIVELPRCAAAVARQSENVFG